MLALWRSGTVLDGFQSDLLFYLSYAVIINIVGFIISLDERSRLCHFRRDG